MEPTQIVVAFAALVAAVAALIRVLSGAFETRFADLRKEIATLRDALETERRLRIAAQDKATSAEQRAQLAEAQVDSLIIVNEKMRGELDLMRAALVGGESEKIQALTELAKRADDAARKRVAGAIEDTAPHKAQRDKP